MFVQGPSCLDPASFSVHLASIDFVDSFFERDDSFKLIVSIKNEASVETFCSASSFGPLINHLKAFLEKPHQSGVPLSAKEPEP